MKRFATTVALTALALGAGATAAAADAPDDPDCWGVVSAADGRAGVMGDHASSFAPGARMGLANTARAFGFDHLSELGAFLSAEFGDDLCGGE